MTPEKKQVVITTLSIKMSRENLYKLKEKVVKERTTMRKYVHFVLGLKMEDEEKK